VLYYRLIRNKGPYNNDLRIRRRNKMNEENVKLSRIKKSCRIGRKVSRIIMIVLIIGFAICLTAGIGILASGQSFDSAVMQGIEEGYLNEESLSIGKASYINIEVIDISDIQTDIPAFREALDKAPYSFTYGLSLIIAGLSLIIIIVVMALITGTFGLIEKEDSPFTAKVMKRVLITLIALCAVLAFTAGFGFALVCAMATWVIYTIMDYGKTLQLQSDETL